MLPLLEALDDGQEHDLKEIIDLLSRKLNLSEKDKNELLPSGTQKKFNNRVAWAKSYLKHAGLIDNVSRGKIKITDIGLSVLAEHPPLINVKYLERFPESDAGQAIGKSGDEGIDGIINEDKLGLDVVYIHAKRWEGTVGRPVVQAFAGSLEGQRAKKGVLITTSKFSQEAIDYVKVIEKKIVLIDGERLAQLMIDFDIGVSEQALYIVKKMDTDYFGDEEV